MGEGPEDFSYTFFEGTFWDVFFSCVMKDTPCGGDILVLVIACAIKTDVESACERS
jgi:hypothetical protein